MLPRCRYNNTEVSFRATQSFEDRGAGAWVDLWAKIAELGSCFSQSPCLRERRSSCVRCLASPRRTLSVARIAATWRS